MTYLSILEELSPAPDGGSYSGTSRTVKHQHVKDRAGPVVLEVDALSPVENLHSLNNQFYRTPRRPSPFLAKEHIT